MLRVFSYILFITFGLVLSAQELYRYTDETGVEHIVDSPYKLPENIREKYIKEYEKKKKQQLPPDLQNTRPAFRDINKNISHQDASQEEQLKKKKADEERQRKIEELTKQMEETVKELGYKTQRALITQIPEIKAEVEKLKHKVEEIKKEIEILSADENNNKKREEKK
ncbi:MAG: hypothetical protein N3B13_01120 [Deltaproteobacteria bacterium]|nr:hypothetical protein [Deltaproteobacteria bacterium]